MTDALCAADHVDPSWFDGDSTNDAHAQAKRICGSCTLAAQCRSDAITRRMSGIWGGVLYFDGLRPGQRRRDVRVPVVRDTRTHQELTVAQAVAAQMAAVDRWADSTIAMALRRARLEGTA